jgi:hypothetical protein
LTAGGKFGRIYVRLALFVVVAITTMTIPACTRTAINTFMYSNLWDVMRIDGVTELPGILSKTTTGVGWGLGIVGGLIFWD